MCELGKRTTKIVRCNFFTVDDSNVFREEIINSLFADSVVRDSASSIDRTEHYPFTQTSRTDISVYRSFSPWWHWHSAPFIALPNEIDYHPAPVSLLNMIERESN